MSSTVTGHDETVGGGTVTFEAATTVTFTTYTNLTATETTSDVEYTVNGTSSYENNVVEFTDDFEYTDLISGDTFDFEPNST